MIYYKVLLLGLLGILVCLAVGSFVTGRGYANSKIKDEGRFKKHKRLGRWSLVLVGLLVLLVEGLVLFSGKSVVRDALFIGHLSVAVSYLATLVLLNWWFNGRKNPRYHARLAYWNLLLFVSMVLTGIILIPRL